MVSVNCSFNVRWIQNSPYFVDLCHRNAENEHIFVFYFQSTWRRQKLMGSEPLFQMGPDPRESVTTLTYGCLVTRCRWSIGQKPLFSIQFSSSVLSRRLHLPPAVLEACCPFLTPDLFFQVFLGRPLLLWPRYIYCGVCLTHTAT